MNRRTLLILIAIAVILGGVVTVGAVAWLVMNWDTFWTWFNSSNDPAKILQCSDVQACNVAHPIVYGLVLIFVILTGFAYTTLLERKLLAWLQQRSGPNRVGPGGFMQPAADAVKLIFKEDIMPDQADPWVYRAAPMLKTIPVLIVVAVIPLGPDILIPWFDGFWYQVPLSLSDVNVGILWILGITSLATYGVVLAGWSSNNKYAILGSLRASAQMVSYELSMGITMAVPVMIAGSMSVGDIINEQKYIWDWFIWQNPLAGAIFTLALFAEVSRAPFDLTEAEQELTAGYMTEYSGMKFAMFMMAEYIGMIAVSMVAISLFFGGYHIFPVDNMPIFGPIFMITKVFLFLAFFIWVRGTLPRVRYDRLMALGWKVMLPLGLLSVAWSAIAVVLRDTSMSLYVTSSAVFFVVVLAGGFYILGVESGEEEEEDIYTDPVVTGERNSLGWAVVTLVGSLIAIPFVIVRSLTGYLENFGAQAQGPSDETALVSSDQGGD